MPKREDIKKILIIGSGPIVIGQACEFDYSGTQACKALKEEGFKVILVNSNPATIMTDPDFSDRTYIEPLTCEIIEKIIEREKPDVLLPTLGGQTALNLAVELYEKGVLQKHRVGLIGANIESIRKAEDRNEFKKAMRKIGVDLPKSGYAQNLYEAKRIQEEIGFPVIIRPSFTLGGTGGNIAYNYEEFEQYVEWGLSVSPARRVLIEESLIGWKEFELEVMRDLKDNVVIVCSIENFDPMGIHTGDSITVAPVQTLTDKEYQRMRDAAIKVMREIGIDTGGSNIQFAINPENGRMVIIEMNPRVSRSSALASKATGFPIAKIAAKLAVGYTLDEILNDITRETPVCFEPTIDYVVVKIPRFNFEKFPSADRVLTTQMKSVGEVMAIGRTFKEALQKAICSLEINSYGFENKVPLPECVFNERERERIREKIVEKLRIANWERIWYIADAIRWGFSNEMINELTKIDKWFIDNIREIIETEKEIINYKNCNKNDKGIMENDFFKELLYSAKRMGFSDRRIGELLGMNEDDVRKLRKSMGIKATFKLVDTCAAEFEAYTPYLYSTYEMEDEAPPSNRKKIVILGSGPNRIGQGIEFDYCCVHALFALKEEGYETIMINCNPETVSTDYDTSDRLYFEPLTKEHVLNIIEKEQPEGVIVQFGGQTPLKLAVPLEREGVRILGTSSDSIDVAEDRDRFRKLLKKLNLKQPESGIARSVEEAFSVARRLGYPVMVRPSYVLGGRAMEIVYDDESLENYMNEAVRASPEHPILIDKFLEDAMELDVDAICDGENVIIGGILEHIEEAGVHSGDSACIMPPFHLGKNTIDEVIRQTKAISLELNVIGLINIQFAIKNGDIYILEVNPRSSRTVPFISKASGIPLAKIASKIIVGRKLKDINIKERAVFPYVAVKEAVFPFVKFPGVDTILGPEMKSTGEVMGIDQDFGRAFAKSQISAGNPLPLGGTVFISVKDQDKKNIIDISKKLRDCGFKIVATRGTAKYLMDHGIDVEIVNKVKEGRPHIVDFIKNGSISLVINTTFGKQSIADSYSIRRSALVHNVPYFTTISAARAACLAIETLKKSQLTVKSIQQYHKQNINDISPC